MSTGDGARSLGTLKWVSVGCLVLLQLAVGYFVVSAWWWQLGNVLQQPFVSTVLRMALTAALLVAIISTESVMLARRRTNPLHTMFLAFGALAVLFVCLTGGVF
jgi:uncharacterized protein YacL